MALQKTVKPIEQLERTIKDIQNLSTVHIQPNNFFSKEFLLKAMIQVIEVHFNHVLL